MKYVLGALAAVTLMAGVAASQPASARCWYNGFGWNCFYPRHHHWWWRHHHFYRPYYREYFSYRY